MVTASVKAVLPFGLGWKAEEIPPFPPIAVRALQLVSDSESSLIELCNLIRADPSFSTAVLRIANSPLVAFSKNITSMVQAAMLLGFRRLRNVVVTLGLKSYLNGGYSSILVPCWRHSLACALIAQKASMLCGYDKDFAFTAGIMHDLGRIAMASTLPSEYAVVVERRANRPYDVLPIEREIFGVDHCIAGRSLATLWGLPQAFHEVIATHHDLAHPGRGSSTLLPPSCRMADALGFSLYRYAISASYEDVLAHFPEPVRTGFPPQGEELSAEIEMKIKVYEEV